MILRRPEIVSILAPRHRGACPTQRLATTTTPASFNPRSPSPGSVSSGTYALEQHALVSILAPRHRGACPPPARSLSPPTRRFNPRSPSPGSVSATAVLMMRLVGVFQSSLPVTGERVAGIDGSARGEREVSILAPRHRGACRRRHRSIGRSPAGFNPRSPSPGSVSPAAARSPSSTSSFNPRSPSPGSVSALTAKSAAAERVSILAPRHRGACPFAFSTCRGRQPFQSSLPVTGERVLTGAAHHVKDQDVSILAPRHRGACQIGRASCRERV